MKGGVTLCKIVYIAIKCKVNYYVGSFEEVFDIYVREIVFYEYMY